MVWFEKLEGTKPARTKPRGHACGIEMCSLLPETEGMEQTASDIPSNPQHANAIKCLPPADAGLLLLLLPNDQPLNSPTVTAWMDAASENGVRVHATSDRQFNNLGSEALKHAGLISPDQLHVIADNALLKSIRDYTQAGGNTMLIYDFGTLMLDSNLKPIYPIPKSRLSDLAGVNYALYDTLREKSIATGSIAAERSTLRELQFPPGKSSPYIAPSGLTNGTAMLAKQDSIGAVSLLKPADVLSLNNAQTTRYEPANSVAETSEPLESYSGYLLGNLIYPSFVTQAPLRVLRWLCLQKPAWLLACKKFAGVRFYL